MTEPTHPHGKRSWWTDLIAAVLVAVIVALFVRTWVVQIFEIPTESMEPALLRGDHVIVNRFIFGLAAAKAPPWLPMRTVRRGDVVVFRFPPDPTRNYVKRSVGLGGDVVEIVDKGVLLNEQPLDETGYATHGDPRTYQRSLFLHDGYRKRDNFGPLVVPPGYFFMLGDNRDDSYDSRFWGQVPPRLLKGRPFLVLWSIEPVQPAPAPPSAGGAIPEPDREDFGFSFRRVRWLRTLRPVR